MSAQRPDDEFVQVGPDPAWSSEEDEVFDLGANDYVDSKQGGKRPAEEDSLPGQPAKKKHNHTDGHEVVATYHITETTGGPAVKLFKIKGDDQAPKFITCHKDDLLTDNPFVNMVLAVGVGGLVPKVVGTIKLARPKKIGEKHWTRFVPKKYPWSRKLLNITGPLPGTTLPPGQASVLTREDDYYVAATHFGTDVADQLPVAVWKAIGQAKNNDFLLLANLGPDVPMHLRWAAPKCFAVKDTPEAEAARVYGRLQEAHEKGQRRDEDLGLLIKWGLVDEQGHLPTYPANMSFKAECHHFSSLLNMTEVMKEHKSRKTLFLAPSDLWTKYFPDYTVKNIAKLRPKHMSTVWKVFDTVVCVMAEYFSNEDWEKIPPTTGGQLVCLGDMGHKVTSPYNDHFFGGFSRLCALNTPTRHGWPSEIDGHTIFPAALCDAILANSKRFLTAPHQHFKHYASCKDWYNVVAQVKGNMPNNQRNTHTAIMPKHTLILCANHAILERAQEAFLTRDFWKGTLGVSKSHPLWSFPHRGAMKIQSYTDTELRSGQTVWPLDCVDGPRQYRLQNLTTINQCNALPTKTLVIIIDESTKRSEIARALKFVDCTAENSMVKIFWTPESKKRSFDYLEL